MSVYANAGQPQLFKYMYPDEAWRVVVNTNRPLLALLPKGDISSPASGVAAAGSGFVHVFNYANPQGSVQDYDVAESQQDSMVAGTQFVLQTSQFYSFLRFNAKDLRASKSSAAAYMSQQKLNATQKLKQMGQEIDLALHRAGNGISATISSVAGSTLILTSAASLQQFQVGMKITSSTTFPTDGTAPALTAAAATVTKVSPGTIVGGQTAIVLTVDNVTGFAAGQGILLQGNGKAIASTNTAGNILGMGNWNPITAPSAADNFLSSGLNRSTDEFRLSGVRMSAAGATYREAIQQICALIHEMGGRPDTVLLNPIDWQRASMELQQFVRLGQVKVGDVTFSSLEMASPAGGMLRLMSDPNQDVGVVRVLTLDTWKLLHMGELIHDIDEDGLSLRKANGSDAFQMGMRSWPQLVCYEPYGNGVLSF